MEKKADIEVENAKNILRVEFNEKLEKVESKITNVDDKVDDLRVMVLPMLESLKQTADNTKEMSGELRQYTAEQRRTNGKFFEKLSNHDVLFADVKGQFAEVGVKLSTQSEAKKSNAALWSALFVTIGGIITAMFQFAGTLFK